MADIDYNALFGVEESENTQESADPAEETEETEESVGENEQDTAEPADDKPKQTKEENAAFAAARRKAEKERDEAVTAAKADADKYIADAFEKAGITNPYTGEKIRTKEDFEAYRDRLDSERKSDMMDKSGMTEAEYQAFVDNLPEVREAKAYKARIEEAEKEEKEQRLRADVDRQIAEISALDSSVKTIDDLKNMENYDAFYALVGKGYSLIDAFKIVNFDSLQSRKTTAAKNAAKQAALNAESKDHLQRTSSRGRGSLSVPDDVMREYRIFNPDASAEEIQKHYNKIYNK